MAPKDGVRSRAVCVLLLRGRITGLAWAVVDDVDGMDEVDRRIHAVHAVHIVHGKSLPSRR